MTGSFCQSDFGEVRVPGGSPTQHTKRAKIALTDRRIARYLPPGEGQRVELHDAIVPALVLRITSNGRKTFSVRYRLRDRTLRFTLGQHGSLGTRAARKLALKVLSQAAVGVDPMDAKRSRAMTRASSPADVSELVERYVREWLPRRVAENSLKKAHASESGRLLRKEVSSRWQGKRLDNIGALDLTNLLNAIEANSTRRHTYFALRAFCNWAHSVGLATTNPIPANYPNPPKPKDRERVLNQDELRRIWTHVCEPTSTFQAIVALLLLTGQRRDEVADAEWCEINLHDKVWIVPGSRTKNGRTHTIPLSDAAVSILSCLPSQGQTYVFPGEGTTRQTFSGWSRSKQRLDRQTRVSGWTLHDLRRTVATRMAENGTQPHVVERLLNHSSGTISGVAAVYNRASYLCEMRSALELWCLQLTRIGDRNRALE